MFRLNFNQIKIAFFLFSLIATTNASGQAAMDRIERGRMKNMLETLKNEIKKDYYDPNFHGIDLEARFKQAKDRIDQVSTAGQAIGVIAQVLIDFNDSHLYFLPPATVFDVEYGIRYQMYGDKCYVIAVKPKSDAESRGIREGDQILAFEGFPPAKRELWKIEYFYSIVSKRTKIKLLVQGPKETTPREVEFESKITQHPKVINLQTIYLDMNHDDPAIVKTENKFLHLPGITIWKMPTFAIPPEYIDEMIDKIRPGNALILDLRRNGGGYVETLERLSAYVFDKDQKIADLKARKSMDPIESKTMGKRSFGGKLVVLVDANSGSASEIFAKLIQLNNRGKVLGDISAGAVMQAKGFFATAGANDEVGYGASITNADVIMSDGKSLENVGVVPDEIVLPTGNDLANKRDPVLMRAVEILGGTITQKDAWDVANTFDWRKRGRFAYY